MTISNDLVANEVEWLKGLLSYIQEAYFHYFSILWQSSEDFQGKSAKYNGKRRHI